MLLRNLSIYIAAYFLFLAIFSQVILHRRNPFQFNGLLLSMPTEYLPGEGIMNPLENRLSAMAISILIRGLARESFSREMVEIKWKWTN